MRIKIRESITIIRLKEEGDPTRAALFVLLGTLKTKDSGCGVQNDEFHGVGTTRALFETHYERYFVAFYMSLLGGQVTPCPYKTENLARFLQIL